MYTVCCTHSMARPRNDPIQNLSMTGQPKKVNHNFLVHFAESLGWELPLYKEKLELKNETAYLRPALSSTPWLSQKVKLRSSRSSSSQSS